MSSKSSGVRPVDDDGKLRGSRLFDAIFEKDPFLIGFEVQVSAYEKEDAKGKKHMVGHKPVQEQAQRLWVEQVVAPRPAVAYKVIYVASGAPVLRKFTQQNRTQNLSPQLRSMIDGP